MNEELAKRFTDLVGGEDVFAEQISDYVKSALDYILDGEESVDDLEACQKTTFGIAFEKRMIKGLGLPRKVSKKNNPHSLKMDSRIGDIDFDVKCTLGHNNWMIPKEAYGHYCFLLKVDWRQDQISAGVFHADQDNLTKGVNRDKKLSISAKGKNTITWLFQDRKL